MARKRNIRNIAKFKRSIKAISPVIATLLMIAIAVVASLVVYAWVSGYLGFQTGKAGKAIQIPSFALNSDNSMTVYAQNVGQGTVQIGPVYVDNEQKVDFTNDASKQIGEGDTVSLTIPGSYNKDIRYDIKVTTTDGTFITTTGKPASSGDSNPPSQPVLTIDIVGSGTVAKSPDQTSYNLGDPVQLTATPAAGWAFAGWSGDLTSSTSPDTVTIDSNPQVTATFTQSQYSLTVTANPTTGGSVTLSNEGPVYHHGDVVTLTPIPNTGYSFSSWAGDLTGSANPGQITITGNMVVTAEFAADPVTLTINQATGGTITANPAGPYHYGDEVQLTATPSTGYTFTAWTGALSGSTNPQTLTLNGDKTVSAIYTINQYTLTVNIVGSGTVSKNPNQATYAHGTVVTLDPSASAGYTFQGWSGDLTGSADPAQITMSSDKTVTATFAQVTSQTVTLRPNNDGRVDDLRNSDGGDDNDNWEYVDETTADGTTTYVYCNSDNNWRDDTYELSNPSLTGTITNVRIHVICAKNNNDNNNVQARTAIRIGNNNIQYGTAIDLTTSWAESYTDYATKTGNLGSGVWTWSDINILEIGVSLRSQMYNDWGEHWTYARCTQVWVEITYTPTP